MLLGVAMRTDYGQEQFNRQPESARNGISVSARKPVQSPTLACQELESQLLQQDFSFDFATAKKVARDCQKVLRDQPDNLLVLELLAKCQWRLNDYDAVQETTLKLLRLNSFEPGYLLLRALAYWAQGRCGSAIVDLQRALGSSTDPGFLVQVDHTIEAIDCYQAELIANLLTIDPVFAKRYEADPIVACRERSFEFSWHPKDDGLPVIGPGSQPVATAFRAS